MSVSMKCSSLALSLCLVAASTQAAPSPTTSPSCADPSVTVDWSSMQKTAVLMRVAYVNARFASVEASMACLDQSAERFAGGEAASSAVYWTFRLKRPSLGSSEEQRQRAVAWRATSPSSIYAQFAQLRQQYDQAWVERGSNSANGTNPAKFGAFYATLATLDAQLRSAPRELQNTAIWNNLMLATLLDERQPTSDPGELYRNAVRRWPMYLDFHEVMLSRLLPRWGGTWGAAERFINTVARNTWVTDGDTLYARLYDSIFGHNYMPGETFVDRERLEKSLREWMNRFPTPENLNRIASAACLLHNESLFRNAYARMGEADITPATWSYQAQPEACLARFKH
jgi:hypothetical protein